MCGQKQMLSLVLLIGSDFVASGGKSFFVMQVFFLGDQRQVRHAKNVYVIKQKSRN